MAEQPVGIVGKLEAGIGVLPLRRSRRRAVQPQVPSPVFAAGGEYGRGHLWLHGPTAGTPEGQDPDAGFELPDDAYWLLGHDGQSTVVIPSRDLVVVRMGLTPSSLGYKPQRMVAELAKHFNEPR